MTTARWDELPPRRPGLLLLAGAEEVDTTRSHLCGQGRASHSQAPPRGRAQWGRTPVEAGAPTWRGSRGATDGPPCAAGGGGAPGPSAR